MLQHWWFGWITRATKYIGIIIRPSGFRYWREWEYRENQAAVRNGSITQSSDCHPKYDSVSETENISQSTIPCLKNGFKVQNNSFVSLTWHRGSAAFAPVWIHPGVCLLHWCQTDTGPPCLPSSSGGLARAMSLFVGATRHSVCLQPDREKQLRSEIQKEPELEWSRSVDQSLYHTRVLSSWPWWVEMV